MNTWNFISTKISLLCKQHNLTLRALAARSNLSVSTLYKIIHNEQIPKLTTVKKICDGFGITLSEFFQTVETTVKESDDLVKK